MCKSVVVVVVVVCFINTNEIVYLYTIIHIVVVYLIFNSCSALGTESSL